MVQKGTIKDGNIYIDIDGVSTVLQLPQQPISLVFNNANLVITSGTEDINITIVSTTNSNRTILLPSPNAQQTGRAIWLMDNHVPSSDGDNPKSPILNFTTDGGLVAGQVVTTKNLTRGNFLVLCVPFENVFKWNFIDIPLI